MNPRPREIFSNILKTVKTVKNSITTCPVIRLAEQKVEGLNPNVFLFRMEMEMVSDVN